MNSLIKENTTTSFLIIREHKENHNIEYLSGYCSYGRDKENVLRIVNPMFMDINTFNEEMDIHNYDYIKDSFNGLIKYSKDDNYIYHITKIQISTKISLLNYIE